MRKEKDFSLPPSIIEEHNLGILAPSYIHITSSKYKMYILYKLQVSTFYIRYSIERQRQEQAWDTRNTTMSM